MKTTIRAWYKAFLLFVHIGGFAVVCVGRRIIRGHDLNWTLRRRQRLVHTLLRILRIDLSVEGTPPEGTAIYIANHRSYLDPVVMHRDLLFLPVAKAEVGKWPVIGLAAKATGVLFVQRNSKSSRQQTREGIAETLRQGHSVCIYPEGTTHIEPQTIAFRPGVFAIAAEHQFPIVPIAIIYPDLQDAWIGKETFVPHLLRLCKKEVIEVTLVYGPLLKARDPENLLYLTQSWIDSRLLANSPGKKVAM